MSLPSQHFPFYDVDSKIILTKTITYKLIVKINNFLRSTERGECHVKTRIEIGVMLPQVKCRKKLRETRKNSLTEPLETE